MKISLLEPLGVNQEVINCFAQEMSEAGHEFIYYPQKSTDPEELKKRSCDSDIIVIANNPFPQEVVEAATNLKMLDVAFTGIDHVATTALKEKGVLLCNASGYSTQTVAELVLAMCVAAYRNLAQAEMCVRSGKTAKGLTGQEIAGKTVGIIGLGAIGLRTAKLFLAFGAKVLAFNRSKNPEAEALGIHYVTLDELLQQSDIISLHLPSNADTKGMISEDKIAKMKPSAVFVNCARGPIVDNKALADALNSEKIAYACIDVFDQEPPLPTDYPLLHAKNTLLTPHIGFISQEAMLRRAEIVFANIRAFLAGKPQNVCKL